MPPKPTPIELLQSAGTLVPIFAHKGVTAKPDDENTLQALENAMRFKVAVEVDLFFTKAGEVLLYHGSPQASEALKEMEDLKPGRHNRPTLQAALDLVDGRIPMLLELKYMPFATPSAITSCLDSLRAYRGPFLVASFDEIVIELVPELPGTSIGLITMGMGKPPARAYDFYMVNRSLYKVRRSWRSLAAPTGLWTFKNLAAARKGLAGTSQFGIVDLTTKELLQLP